MKNALIFAGAIAFGFLALLIAPGEMGARVAPQDPYALTPQQKCIGAGIDFYEEVGSYPTFSDGRDAHKVIVERCKLNPRLWK